MDILPFFAVEIKKNYSYSYSNVHNTIIAKDRLLTLVKSRLALGSPGWLFGCSFVTMPKMAEYTDK